MKPKPPSAETTRPSANSLSRDARWGTASIQWLHPERRISPLVTGHSLGRDAACDTVLSGSEVSRKHAEVTASGALHALRDLGSRNGVFVDGERTSEAVLHLGSVLRIGEWVGVVLELPAQTAPGAALHAIQPGWYAGPALQRALAELRKIAAKDMSIVVQGESGTGKEGVAQAIHAWSGRKGRFIAVDCGSLPEQLAEGELFGYRRGAFTGADHTHPGLFRDADQGTLFLDEVLNLSLALQAKLLRALEEHEVRPLGTSTAVEVDVRVLCAAQMPLSEATRRQAFRSDLSIRLEGYTFKLPALRERKEDIVPLFLRLLEDRGCSAPVCEAKLLEALLLYAWPLNVRELVRFTERLLALHGHGPFTRSMLPDSMRAARGADASQPRATRSASTPRKEAGDVASFEALVASMQEHSGNLTKAAAALGIDRSRANRILAAHPEFDRASLRSKSRR